MTFHVVDHVVFIVTLVLSLGIGIYYAIKDRHKKQENRTSHFLVGGRKMALLPVSISLFVSWMSSISLLGEHCSLVGCRRYRSWVIEHYRISDLLLTERSVPAMLSCAIVAATVCN